MSARDYASIVAPLREAAVHAAWTQWGAVGFGPVAPVPARAIVDPEALVLASLALSAYERRLPRILQMWIRAGSRLLSVGRLSNLMRDYPASLAEAVTGFAAEGVAAGDARWKKLAAKASVRRPSRRGVETSTPNLKLPATLMLRLRLALGVGIKADALAFLLGGIGARQTVRGIASSTGYFERAVRRALEDLVAARLVETQPTSPVSYFARWKSWEQLLGVDENTAPVWRGWHEHYVGAVALDTWGHHADEARWTPYVAASRLRDEFERLTPILVRARLHDLPDWSGQPEGWLDEMRRWVGEMAYRMKAVA